MSSYNSSETTMFELTYENIYDPDEFVDNNKKETTQRNGLDINRELFKNPKWSDMEFHLVDDESKKIPAHKCIVAVGSEFCANQLTGIYIFQ